MTVRQSEPAEQVNEPLLGSEQPLEREDLPEVTIGSVVTVLVTESENPALPAGEERTFRIAEKADPPDVISAKSPMAKALLNKHEEDDAVIIADTRQPGKQPKQLTTTVEIKSILYHIST